MGLPVGVYRRYPRWAPRRRIFLAGAAQGAIGKPCPVNPHPRGVGVGAHPRSAAVAARLPTSVGGGSRAIQVTDFPSPRKTDVDPKEC